MLSYYLFYPILYLLSLLPLRILYLFASFFKFVLFDCIGYRKKVILTNLRNSFPEKSEKEIQVIAQKFYLYFCDLIFEIIKSLSMSYKELERRFHIPEELWNILQGFADKNQPVLVAIGHHGNWEWAGNAYSVKAQHTFYAIFRPLHNKGFNKIVEKVRTRFKTKLITDRDVIGAMRKIREQNVLSATVFLTDQTPSGKNMYWTKFLNQDTPVFWGVERIAHKFNYPIIYATFIREKRGYYKAKAYVLVDDPKKYPEEGAISELHTRAIEAAILNQPETWLWTHRRWKRKKPGNMPGQS
ncbi:MAG: hypothetical protein BGO31_20190 [Bacteroidetes bacterium 43-16]|nr:MAG: hypothetical protein BGO31_20190 [Bacteroidetes bacterium 43-16]